MDRTAPQSWACEAEEPPPFSRWRVGPLHTRLRAGNPVRIWHPGDGDLRLTEADGVETLQLDDTGWTLAQILDAIVLEPRSAKPQPSIGAVDVQRVMGRLTIGKETIRFRGILRIVVGGWSLYKR
ncbi:hypothetical protein G3576_09040 [Roseomonas stagni]|uniref:Uncharacterized protein n=1 Tax=Falsiroseomonas algicola TaxID=2716930 RepID=A0A6M1LJ07_9PROT|nr:hypothetical protein [Falsiroseomonas algicola]NGM20157.1 hypothetical protein [Falsiroseomonas algicola]